MTSKESCKNAARRWPQANPSCMKRAPYARQISLDVALQSRASQPTGRLSSGTDHASTNRIASALKKACGGANFIAKKASASGHGEPDLGGTGRGGGSKSEDWMSEAGFAQ